MELNLHFPLHVLSLEQLLIHENVLPWAHKYTAFSLVFIKCSEKSCELCQLFLPFFATLLKHSQNSQELFKELSFLPCWSTLGVGVLFLTILSLSGVHEKQTNEGSCTHAQCLAQHCTDVWNPQIPRKLKHQHDKELGIWFHPLPLLVQLFVVTTCIAFTL